ncbi:MAG: phosphate ABC transporter permease subunit PstC [Treponema sp.]|nr:phosphate ABC transporter permease subunit PstC [Treponema sp.]
MKNNGREAVMKYVFLATACVSVGAVILICIFMFANGVPAMVKIGFGKFLFGMKWKPELDLFGIFPMIMGSVAVTLGAILLGVPVGILTAVFLARFCPKGFHSALKSGVDLLAGIPSVVYGFFGLTAIVPLIGKIGGGSGTSILAASMVLAVMILPTIIGVSEAAIRAVPSGYYEGSLALGACKERSVFFAELPAARSGIVAGIILGVGRAIGETMAVIMVAGNQAVMPRGLFKGVRTLTANIVLEMGYASGLHREALIATAVVLFFFILIINLLFMHTKQHSD